MLVQVHTLQHPGYGTLLCPMDSPLPEHKLSILWLVRKQAQALVQADIQKMIGMIPKFNYYLIY